jgi:tRNA-2-methylthio-N6-dimethylallyladenosine synthase
MKETAVQPLAQCEAQPRYLYVQTFGCQMNEYDSLKVQRALAPRGYLLTSDMEAADVIFLNTCSVREKAEQKVHSFLGRLRRLKARHPGLKIIVAGCVAQQLGKELLGRFDYLDLVVGTRGVASIGRLLERILETGERMAFIPDEEEQDLRDREDPGEMLPLASPGGFEVASSVTIMQGCDNFCTYCIVPYVRGRERSRPTDQVLREIRMLAEGGTREILLLGQNVNSYGRGLDEKTSFVDLLRHIQAETGVSRVRFTTSHPKDLTDELIGCFADLPVLCKNLHLPVQAGSDRILDRMNRGYTAAQYLDKIRKLRRACPEIALSSDVMVGFPGETEEDYEATLRLLQEVRFDALFSFRYSDRPYARSAHFPDKVDEKTKTSRLIELQFIQAEISLAKNQAEVGRTREILVEGPSKASNGQLTGRTQQNRIVNFEGPKETIGRLIHIKIVSALSHSLKGESVSGEP